MHSSVAMVTITTSLNTNMGLTQSGGGRRVVRLLQGAGITHINKVIGLLQRISYSETFHLYQAEKFESLQLSRGRHYTTSTLHEPGIIGSELHQSTECCRFIHMQEAEAHEYIPE